MATASVLRASKFASYHSDDAATADALLRFACGNGAGSTSVGRSVEAASTSSMTPQQWHTATSRVPVFHQVHRAMAPMTSSRPAASRKRPREFAGAAQPAGPSLLLQAHRAMGVGVTMGSEQQQRLDAAMSMHRGSHAAQGRGFGLGLPSAAALNMMFATRARAAAAAWCMTPPHWRMFDPYGAFPRPSDSDYARCVSQGMQAQVQAAQAQAQARAQAQAEAQARADTAFQHEPRPLPAAAPVRLSTVAERSSSSRAPGNTPTHADEAGGTPSRSRLGCGPMKRRRVGTHSPPVIVADDDDDDDGSDAGSHASECSGAGRGGVDTSEEAAELVTTDDIAQEALRMQRLAKAKSNGNYDSYLNKGVNQECISLQRTLVGTKARPGLYAALQFTAKRGATDDFLLSRAQGVPKWVLFFRAIIYRMLKLLPRSHPSHAVFRGHAYRRRMASLEPLARVTLLHDHVVSMAAALRPREVLRLPRGFVEAIAGDASLSNVNMVVCNSCHAVHTWRTCRKCYQASRRLNKGRPTGKPGGSRSGRRRSSGSRPGTSRTPRTAHSTTPAPPAATGSRRSLRQHAARLARHVNGNDGGSDGRGWESDSASDDGAGDAASDTASEGGVAPGSMSPESHASAFPLKKRPRARESDVPGVHGGEPLRV